MGRSPSLTARSARSLRAWLTVGLVVTACAGGQQVTPPGLQVPGDPELGRAALAEYGCIACHAIPGVRGNHTEVGPPLAGFARRRVIAGRLPNTPANVAAWVENPQAVDPGNAMPDLGVTPEDAEHIAAYLYTLR
ncbi:MAG TPA: c-type cytochrome [Egibacteraceae bacterium]|nr:c-type cytochrome [Egibacteraceae bacterium]